jgi:universal stress protein A
MTAITRILVPTDFSETSDAALDYAYALACRLDASLHLLHVIDDPVADGLSPDACIVEGPALRTALLENARDCLAHRAARDEPRVPVQTEVVFGHGSRTIAEYATDRSIDLIVMGTHGRTGVAHVLLGSVAERVVRTAPCPVLTVRHRRVRTGRVEFEYDTATLPT